MKGRRWGVGLFLGSLLGMWTELDHWDGSACSNMLRVSDLATLAYCDAHAMLGREISLQPHIAR